MKSIVASMRTHLDGTVTTLTSIWRIERTDGVNFYFTDHDEDIVFDDGDGSATYIASTGYNRTAVASNVGLAVDNMDVEGVFDDASIKEDELRAGLFDYATVWVSLVNWADLNDGAIKMKKGKIGEVIITPQGIFRGEQRGLTQELSQNIVKPYQAECRVDLGSTACGVQIRPDVMGRNTAVTVGQFFRVPTKSAGITYGNLIQNKSFEQAAAANPQTTIPSWTIAEGSWRIASGTVEGLAAQDGSIYLMGADAASGELTQTVNLANVGVSTTEIDAGNVTADFSIERANNDVDDTGRVLVSFLDTDGNPVSTMYDSTTEEITPVDTWTTRSAAAVAVPATTRQIIVRLFHTRVTGTPSNVAFDNVSLTVTDSNSVSTLQEVYENRIYEVTTAGTTAASVPAYTTTIDATTTDGTAVVTARDSFTRHADIIDVTDTSNFEITVSEARAVDGWFDGGALIVEDGPNAGTVREIKNWTQTGGIVSLFLAEPFTFYPGQKVRVYPGCDKRLATCSGTFSNVINFRGEPYVPGQDQITRTPDAP
jgi:hypothetical protein